MKKRFNRRNLRIGFFTLVGIIAICLFAFFIWTQNTYEAIDAQEIKIEEVKNLEGGWYMYPAEDGEKGIILYPGAKVEPEAYAYLAQELAKRKISVAIPSYNLNLPILDVSRADEMIKKNDHLKWYVAGHSMGGAAAAMYADQNLDKVNGLLLLGAYAADNDLLRESNLPVLSISGSEDGLSTPEKVKTKRVNLPPTARFIEIEGGNHAYFGVYGHQSGDNEAKISVSEQQHAIIDSITHWLDSADSDKATSGN